MIISAFLVFGAEVGHYINGDIAFSFALGASSDYCERVLLAAWMLINVADSCQIFTIFNIYFCLC
jgi:hypothetical protein